MKKLLILALFVCALVYFSPVANASSRVTPEKIHHKHHQEQHQKHHHHHGKI